MSISPALRKEVERTVKANEFQQDVERLLAPADKDYLLYALKEFSSHKNVTVLIQALTSCLDTPDKLDMLPVVRDLLPRHDQREFDMLAPYKKMAHPRNMYQRRKSGKHLRTVWVKRDRQEPVGMSIRGGKEIGLGIYISAVEFDTPADQAGLLVGDQIIEVNGIDFEWISHESAIMAIKAFGDLCVVLKSVGRLPQLDGDAFTWVDPLGRPVDKNKQPIGVRDDRRDSDLQLLSSVDKRRLVVKKKTGVPLGLSIRGGKEFNLGIYVVGVDNGSLAEKYGLQVGDQILLVNDHSFRSILHAEAVSVLRNDKILMMTVKSVGKIPKLAKSRRKNKDQQFKPLSEEAPDASPVEASRSTDEPTASSNGDIVRSATNPNLSELQPSEVSPSSSPFMRMRSNSLKAASSSPTGSLRGIKQLDRSSFRMPGGSPLLRRSHNGGTNGVSPLATAQMKASPEEEESTPFEYGMGTQVMLSSVQTPARELLIAQARRELSEEDVKELTTVIESYEESRDVNELAEFLIYALDTPEKMELLRDVRPVLHPTDLSEFDKLISPHEYAAISEKNRSLDELQNRASLSMEQKYAEQMKKGYNEVISSLQNKPKPLQKVKFAEEGMKSSSSPELGYFNDPNAHELVDKARDMKEPLTLSPQSRESFLAWNEEYQDGQYTTEPQPFYSSAMSKPTHFVLEKTAPILGIVLEGGGEEPLMIAEVVEGGAAFEDGVLTPGFLLLEIDGVSLKDSLLSEAELMLIDAYNSEEPTIDLLVLPPPI